MTEQHINAQEPRKVFLVGLTTSQANLTYELEELANLAKANNLVPVETFTQSSNGPTLLLTLVRKIGRIGRSRQDL